jgi:hypothetical protein
MNQRFKFTSPTSTVRRYFIGLPSAPSLPTDAAPSSLSVSPELFLPTRKRAQERGRHGGTSAPPPPPRPLSLSLAYSSSSSLSLPRLSPSPPHLSISQSLSSDVVDPRDGWPPVRQHADVGRAPAIAAAPFLYPRSSPHPLPLPRSTHGGAMQGPVQRRLGWRRHRCGPRRYPLSPPRSI